MRVLFRADSGIHIGQGHLARCLNLARLFLRNGWDVHFVVRDHKNRGNIPDSGIQTHVLAPGVDEALPPEYAADYSRWLGVSPEQDLAQLREVVLEIGDIDVFVVDHYALDGSYQRSIPAKCALAIDDLANRSFHCDLLVNQNPNASLKDYDGLLDQPAEILLGPNYAPLDPRFEKIRPLALEPLAAINNVGVFLGGSDPTGETLKIAQAFQSEVFDFDLKVLLSSNHRDYLAVKALAEQNAHIELTSRQEDMASFWKQCDVVIGAVGVSSWERACLGKATFMVIGAENQRAIAEFLHANGYSFLCGEGAKLQVEDWSRFFAHTLQDLNLVHRLQRKSYELCDGRGAQRVYNKVLDIAGEPPRLS